MKIILAKQKVMSAIETWGGTDEEKKAVLSHLAQAQIGFSNSVRLDTTWTPLTLLSHLLDVGDHLTERQRAQIYVAVNGVSADHDMLCLKPADVHTMITGMRVSGAFNVEHQINGRWYPMVAKSAMIREREGSGQTFCDVTVQGNMVDSSYSFRWLISSDEFEDDAGGRIELTGEEVLRRMQMRHITQDLAEYTQKCTRAEHRAKNVGQLVAAVGTGLVSEKVWYTEQYFPIDLGTRETPKKVVIEPSIDSDKRRDNKVLNVLPFVRAFSLELKRYVYLDVDDIEEYEFDDTALRWLVLPGEQKDLLSKLFYAARLPMFGDVLKDKHGGMIILANGPTGVGKTLTAEVFAEVTHAPLYVMELAELGINVEKIEENLGKIFRRVTRWHAVLLMDEADIFLAERGSDLTRSVIVGIFLRLMDYYKGLMFLTSNRASTIDEAFKSRITLQVDYPTLDATAREKIWRVMLERAKITVVDDLTGVAGVEVNGRQIRNMVRLLKVLYGDRVTKKQIEQVCGFVCK